MSTPQQYGRAVFELLLKRLDFEDRATAMEHHRICDDGVYLRPIEEIIDIELLEAEYDAVAWHPLRDVSKPALLFPFTVRELAAFCFPGSGSSLIVSYEDIDGLDPNKLANLGRNGDSARQLVIETHALLLELNTRFFLAQHQSCIEGDDTADTSLEDAALAWLFGKQGEPPEPEAMPRLTTLRSIPLPVGPAPIPTSDMSAALANVLGKNTKSWQVTLGDPPKWLQQARVKKGCRAQASTWHPIELASAISKRHDIHLADLKPIFWRRELREWRDEWAEHLKDTTYMTP
ncbi:hypothetical protein FXN63_07320 [Pigmentiphaga aceris]|uniref:Uncharacterized protein n=1 Tax=Pigmentiphaga aceris TaxID=1940612 RepID=A0A5C0AYN1_9BURK|nr:hypothetical protein [Pigmentiphaga aceris]QEI05671.1 hypothetical protein FXN63_07320 [Pigmentiphaga aceris]